jgi:hypothetical protein
LFEVRACGTKHADIQQANAAERAVMLAIFLALSVPNSECDARATAPGSLSDDKSIVSTSDWRVAHPGDQFQLRNTRPS